MTKSYSVSPKLQVCIIDSKKTCKVFHFLPVLKHKQICRQILGPILSQILSKLFKLFKISNFGINFLHVASSNK